TPAAPGRPAAPIGQPARPVVARAAAPTRPVVSRSAAPEDDDDLGADFPAGDDLEALPDLGAPGEGAIAPTAARATVSRTPAPRLARTTTATTPASDGATALAPAARPVVSRVAAETARPHLQLVRTEPTPTPTPAITPAQPTISRAAERVAGATGGAIEQGEGGLSTVHFPPPAEISTTHQPYTISRELSDPAPSAASVEQHTPAEHPADDSKSAQMDPEALYEYFLDRFKRDLLIEREQLGHLLIDNP
ncbi:hypothetical protein OM076_43990, partial [Solirubrobacter ginsenosidimutans]